MMQNLFSPGEVQVRWQEPRNRCR